MLGTPTDFATPTSGIFPAPATRTRVDILAERRENALELHRETDATARAMLDFHIAKLDAELEATR